MENIVYKEKSYKIIGACMEVHTKLGFGLLEILYKDALAIEFEMRGIPFEREKMFKVFYKSHELPHAYNADFVVYGDIIIEVKAQKDIVDAWIKQTLNYVAIAKSPLGLIVNFGRESLQHKRLVL